MRGEIIILGIKMRWKEIFCPTLRSVFSISLETHRTRTENLKADISRQIVATLVLLGLCTSNAKLFIYTYMIAQFNP
jgi:hypothetical protein